MPWEVETWAVTRGINAGLLAVASCLHTRAAVERVEVMSIPSNVACVTRSMSDTGSESRFLLTPPAFNAPVRGWGVGFPSQYCHDVWYRKLEWCGYPNPMVKFFWRYVYSFRQNVRTWQTDVQTPHDGPHLHIIARQKKPSTHVLLSINCCIRNIKTIDIIIPTSDDYTTVTHDRWRENLASKCYK